MACSIIQNPKLQTWSERWSDELVHFHFNYRHGVKDGLINWCISTSITKRHPPFLHMHYEGCTVRGLADVVKRGGIRSHLHVSKTTVGIEPACPVENVRTTWFVRTRRIGATSNSHARHIPYQFDFFGACTRWGHKQNKTKRYLQIGTRISWELYTQQTCCSREISCTQATLK
jgi:hypothetical protein